MEEIKLEINIPKSSIKNTSGNTIKWGDNDSYPYFLNYLFINSGMHQGIINGKINYIYSGGLKGVEANGFYFLDDINEIVKKLIKDYEIFNGFALYFEKFSGILKCDYISIANLRILKDGNYAYCENWGQKKNIKYYYNYFDNQQEECVALFGIDPFILSDENSDSYINNYPIPIYNSAIPSIMTDIAIKYYNLGEIYNGFKASSIIDIVAGRQMSEEERNEYLKDIKKSIYSKNSWGSAYINFSEGDSPSVNINPIPQTDMVDRYNAVWDAVKEDILISHQITNPLLVGIKTPGQLGGATELATSFDIFRSQYILPRRKYLLDCLKNIGIDIQINEMLPNFLKTSSNSNSFSFEQEKKFIEDERVDDILALFDKVGRNIDGCSIVYEHELADDGSGGIDDYEIAKILRFSQNLTYNDYVILNTINEKGNLLEVCNEVGISKERLDKSLEILKELGYIKGFEVTKDGRNLLKQSNLQVIRTYYRYTVKPGFGEPIIPTSRKFCKQMIRLNRLYTKKEIDTISARAGLDVWLYRGGMLRWGDKVYPWCRHYWHQVFVLEPINQ